MSFKAFRRVLLAAAVLVITPGHAAAWCVRGVAGWDTLRIRQGPSPEARELGGIPANACGVAIVGGCRGMWCPVAWRGRTGWSNAVYLSQGGSLAFAPPPLRMPAWVLPPPPPRITRAAPLLGRPFPQAPQRIFDRPLRPRVAAPARQRPIARAEPPAPPAPLPAPLPAPAPVAPPPDRQAAPAAPAAPPPAPPVPTAGAAVVAPPATPGDRDYCIVDVAKGDTLKVRAGPGVSQPLRFGFPAEVCGVRITGACRDGWCPVEYRGYRGWAERRFLSQ